MVSPFSHKNSGHSGVGVLPEFDLLADVILLEPAVTPRCPLFYSYLSTNNRHSGVFLRAAHHFVRRSLND